MVTIASLVLHAGEPVTGVEYLSRILLTLVVFGWIAVVVYWLSDVLDALGARRSGDHRSDDGSLRR